MLNPVSFETHPIDVWVHIQSYLSPVDISIMSLVNKIFYKFSSHSSVWKKIGYDMLCISDLQKIDNPKAFVSKILRKTHQAGLDYFTSFLSKEIQFFKRHRLLLQTIRQMAQSQLDVCIEKPDLLRLCLQAGAKPIPQQNYFTFCVRYTIPFETFELLIKKGAKASHLLIYCFIISHRSKKELEWLINQGAVPEINDLKTAVVERSSPEIIDLLVDRLDPVNEGTVITAIEENIPLPILEKILNREVWLSEKVFFFVNSKDNSKELLDLLKPKIKLESWMTFVQLSNNEKNFGFALEGIHYPPFSDQMMDTIRKIYQNPHIRIIHYEIMGPSNPLVFVPVPDAVIPGTGTGTKKYDSNNLPTS